MENVNTNTLIVALLALLVGLVVGLALGNRGIGAPMMGATRGGEMHDMDEMMYDMAEELEGLQGDEFDRAFIDEMIIHHEGAIDMAEAALKSAQHEEIKQMARDIISAQTREIEQLETWEQTWYKTR